MVSEPRLDNAIPNSDRLGVCNFICVKIKAVPWGRERGEDLVTPWCRGSGLLFDCAGTGRPLPRRGDLS